jgi:hypothetical protein
MSRTRIGLALVLVIALSAPAFASQIKNGSFEDTTGGTGWVSSITSWTLAPTATVAGQTAGIWFKVNGFNPVDGSTYSALTNNGGVNQAMASSTFTIERERIDFSWIYATKNAPADATHKDPFTVTLATTGNLGPTSASWTVSDVDDSGLGLGTVGTAPWGGGNTYDTQTWQTFSIDTTNLQGQTATLTFTINDSAAGGGVSGVFIDDVAHLPEPSTMVLFGVGFVGLALFGRKRFGKK